MLPSTHASRADPLKTALALKLRSGRPGAAEGRVLASGEGWRVADVVCTSGPSDRRFEERHSFMSISLVLAGSFVYRSDHGSVVLSPGSVLLGNAGRCFECGHEHGEGDRCLSFQFAPELFERLASEAGVSRATFARHRLAPTGALSPLLARSRAAAESGGPFEELALELAGEVVRLASDATRDPAPTATDEHRVSGVLRLLEDRLDARHTLDELARTAGLSRYHFLRTFKRVTGITPHQWLIRARLREAAHRLATTRAPVTEIALDVGFDDLSNFTKSFRAEFGEPPRRYRARSH
ncbi:AraC family transcriptional regulator [Vitiosangium sp. GDMCC 1.1324]|uniref:AraC family transcriptional regulator n=1 Tax=Vitiosangium sp. (strain GDMCC 1.1324) TaxID=2138576 RepID=UPI000D3441EE|nr:AraC family transcriptional regulator [Vitiosangium sp. GDMCC 1.1324]PTL84004.1 AraC family transcriptional regulator [Vitiosangium sp. GDMCC 1.1324]